MQTPIWYICTYILYLCKLYIYLHIMYIASHMFIYNVCTYRYLYINYCHSQRHTDTHTTYVKPSSRLTLYSFSQNWLWYIEFICHRLINESIIRHFKVFYFKGLLYILRIKDIVVKPFMKTCSWFLNEVFLEPPWPLKEAVYYSQYFCKMFWRYINHRVIAFQVNHCRFV